MMKKCLVLLLAAAALLLTTACQTTEIASPGEVVSAFFTYIANGDVEAADRLLTYSNGEFSEVTMEMYQDMGAFIFHGIAYRNLEYTINRNSATASFIMINNDLSATAAEVGFAIGYELAQSGLVDPDDPNFNEVLEGLFEERFFPAVGARILTGTAPTFEREFTINLRLVNNEWRIVDRDLNFMEALLGTAG
ncbi:MAG: hypothetical protein FWC71_10980 [Defluviitaleaceae bacterium]|nr:hypothetical protein [Defluviitaleaceae bacterium]